MDRPAGSATLLFDRSVRPASRRAALGVLLAAALLALAGLGFAPAFLSKTRATGWRAPPDSPSRTAAAKLSERFPSLARSLSSQVVIVLRATDGQSTVLTEAVEAWSHRLVDATTHDQRAAPFRPLIAGYYTGVQQFGLPPRDPLLHAGFVSSDNRTTVIVLLATAEPPSNSSYSLWAYKFWLMSFLRQVVGSSPLGVEAQLAGGFASYFDELRSQRLEPVLMWAELRVVPMALLVLALLVQEVRLLLLPPLLLGLAALAAASAALPVAFAVPLSTDLPPSMVSVLIALSLDYCLFMLARFNENRAQNLSLQRNIDVLVRQTGPTVALSGLLIAVAYFGALSLPAENLRNAGLALGVTTVVVVLVNVCVLPSLLLAFGNALTLPFPTVLRLMQSTGKAPRSRKRGSLSLVQRRASEGDESSSADAEGPPLALVRSGPWVWLMQQIERRPITAVAAIFAVFLPVLVQLPRLHASADAYGVLPMNLGSVAALRSLQGDFVVGRFEPYMIVVAQRESTVGRASAKFVEPDGHRALLELAHGVRGMDGVGSMLGPVWLMQDAVPWGASHRLPPKIRELYRKVANSHLVHDGSAAVLQVHTSFLPQGPHGDGWVLYARAMLRAWEEQHPAYEASLTGPSCEAADAKAAVMGSMPMYLGSVLIVVMSIVLLMFGSVLLPLRLAVAIVFTIAATFGITVLVYQTPLLHGFCPWLAQYHGLCYQVIPMAACVAVALGIDYDIFLVSRIFECRLKGLSDSASIVQGVARTGGIISGAGLIMSLAFSGLFFSEKLMHQQIALTLVTSVLLDTFVVRTVLVPALMLVARRWNWWPRAMPLAEDDSDGDTACFELTPGAASPGSRTRAASSC